MLHASKKYFSSLAAREILGKSIVLMYSLSEISRYTELGREIKAGNNMEVDLEEVMRVSWERRPFVDNDEFC